MTDTVFYFPTEIDGSNYPISTRWAVVASIQHDNRVISRHKSERAAIESARRANQHHARTDCKCPGYRVRKVKREPLGYYEYAR